MSFSKIRKAYCARHYIESPQHHELDDAPTWITRGVNIVTAITEAGPGTTLSRVDQPDEYMLILLPGVSAHIRTGKEELDVGSDSLTIIPPGESAIKISTGGLVARIFTSRAKDLAINAVNATHYECNTDHAVAPLLNWPEPADGFRVRNYPLAQYRDVHGPRIQPRTFRSTNLMVNVFVPWETRRDPRTLSPHWHADFEQASLGLQGEFVHHIRYPWESDSTQWQEDEHILTGSPSVVILPPPAIHTTQDVGLGTARLIDIFSPPRADFSLKPGFVLNESDYPLPSDLQSEATQSGGSLMDWQKG
ncbi:hypothetical protein ACVFVO_14405 [Advenella kashmirensis]